MGLIQGLGSLFSKEDSIKNHFAELSYVGNRNSNQDYAVHLFSPQGKLFIVADGLGGHKGGELASQFFCEAFLIHAREKLNKLKKNPEEALISITELASNDMSEKLIHEHPGINAHTTCAICWLSNDNKLSTLHIGDSRIYWFNALELHWRSRDHSVVQMLVDTGVVAEKNMGTHPDQGALTRSIGVGKKTKPSFKSHQSKMKKGDALLLCSDGFWEMITRNEILSLAKTKKPEQTMTTWIKTAIDRAQPRSDNVTAQLYIL